MTVLWPLCVGGIFTAGMEVLIKLREEMLFPPGLGRGGQVQSVRRISLQVNRWIWFLWSIISSVS
jgi:hypothetical protein